MPCGLLYGAFALAASASTPSVGAATMLAFGIGTLPVMLTVSAFARKVSGYLARRVVRRTAGALVLGFGIFATLGLARQAGIGAAFGVERHCCPTHTAHRQ
jgi:sulfite exporter TauE/SafE